MRGTDPCAADLVTPPDDEELARRVLTPVLAGNLVAHHPRPDFVLCRNGEPVGWLEVTRATHEASHRLQSNLERMGGKIYTDQLSQDWLVTFETTADLRRLDTQRLVEALALDERMASRDAIGQRDRRVQQRLALEDTRDYPKMRAILNECDVHSTHPLRAAEGQAKILLSQRGHASFVNADFIADLAEEKMTLKQKSLDGRTGELHLFVLVDVHERSGASIAMGGYDPELPDRMPVFPRWCTDVWLIPTYFVLRLWHANRDADAWETLDVHLS